MTLDASRPVLQTLGNYDLLDKIAEGGMGSIYRARNRLTGEIVAIKVMTPGMTNNAVLLKRFEQEFRAASRLNHANIVRAIDYGEANGSPYLVMEFVDGESLGARLERVGHMSETEAIRLIAQVAQGLYRAHKQKLIHRDVKPDNILVTAEGQAKLADLGLVKEVAADLNLTRTGRGLGTPHFMAPEQFRNAKNADERCDIYSLGATLYQMVTGELPFKSTGPLEAWMKKMQNEITPPRDLVPTLSERVDWAIRRAMSGDPTQRPRTCREFVEDLTGHSTKKINTADLAAAIQADLWYLVYKDLDDGTTHTVKGSTGAIRRSLKDGLLGDASNVRASRSKSGNFEPLTTYPEFRDLVVAPAPMNVASNRATPPTAPTPPPSGANRRGAVVAVPVANGVAPSDSGPPLIELGAPAPRPVSLEWVKWVLMIAIIAGAVAAVFFLMPRGTSLFPR